MKPQTSVLASNKTVLDLYILVWAAWVLWVHTIGRLPYGLSLPVTLLFDGGILFFCWNFKFYPDVNTPILNALIPKKILFSQGLLWMSLVVLVLCSMIFTAFFQLPLDWDGMDYHLPPLVEAWQNGSWAHSLNPYFAARNYPKSGGLPFLLWICHFGDFLGLRAVLVVSLFHWIAGLCASYFLFGKNLWTFLFWVSFPLICRQGVNAYADLPALTSLLIFCVFILQKKPGLAALALALHGSTKFTHLASGVGAIIGLQLFWLLLKENIFSAKKLKTTFFISIVFLIFAILQPLENYFYENKPFGPLQCKFLGYDFCSGSIDPGSMVVEPVIDFPKNQNWLVKIFRGWSPAQLIPGTDVHHGGFGWAWLLPLFYGLFCLIHRKALKQKSFSGGFAGECTAGTRAGSASDNARCAGDKLGRKSDTVLCGVMVLSVADFFIPALWYPRYHLGLGWILCMLAAFSLEKMNVKSIIYKISMFALFLQLFWIFPQRAWFLGIQNFSDLPKFFENLKSITINGHPKHATHSSDQRSFQFYGLRNKKILVCTSSQKDPIRPIVAAYGASLTNSVQWTKECTEPNVEYLILEKN